MLHGPVAGSSDIVFDTDFDVLIFYLFICVFSYHYCSGPLRPLSLLSAPSIRIACVCCDDNTKCYIPLLFITSAMQSSSNRRDAFNDMEMHAYGR